MADDELDAPAVQEGEPAAAPDKGMNAARAVLAQHRRPVAPPPAPVPSPVVKPLPSNVLAKSPGAKSPRKKPSGKKPTKKELEAQVRDFRAAQKANASSAIAPAAPGAVVDPMAPATSGLERDEVRARFALGVGKFLGMIFGLIAIRRGVHWKLETEEKTAIGEAMADAVACIEQFAPALAPYVGVAVTLTPIATLGGVAYELVASRLETETAIAKGEKTRVMPAKPEMVRVDDERGSWLEVKP